MLSTAPVAVIDIGSNSVRLVAYDRLSRAPIPIFNEKSLCGLGREVAVTGHLPADGLSQAVAALRRFRVLCDVMKIGELHVLATAAVRRAENGPAFIAEVRRILGVDVTVLSGQEEAQLAAYGVLGGLHQPDGLVGDLGGGSLELIDVRHGVIGEGISLDLGGLALRDAAGRSLKKAGKITAQALAAAPVIQNASGRNIYAIGGTWRAIARLHMAQIGYPLNVLHEYTCAAEAMIAFCAQLQKANIASMPAIGEIARERRPLLGYGALVLENLLRMSDARRFVVSAYGVREGLLYMRLEQQQRLSDALLVGARGISDLNARAPAHADELIAWTDHFARSGLPDETPDYKRLRHVACLISEIAWRANPDYRAEEAARFIAYAALPSISHRERAFLAGVQHARYEGLAENVIPPLRGLLIPAEIDAARMLGCLLRVAYNISAGQPGILSHTPIEVRGGSLILSLPATFMDLSNERLLGRLKQVARILRLNPEVKKV